MTPYLQTEQVTLFRGDCLDVLRSLPDASIDAVVTDPPYGLSNTAPADVAATLARWVSGDHEAVPGTRGGFMGKDWDAFVPPPAVWAECHRVLKPGGHLLAFAGTRTQDLMGLAVRLAGFELRDGIGWIYGSGFPKSLDVSKAIDKSSGQNQARQYEFTEWMRSTGITARQIDEATGTHMGGHYLTAASQPAIATADLFDRLRHLLPEVPERIERLVAERTGIEWTDYVKRPVTGKATEWTDRTNYAITSGDGLRRDVANSPDAQKWAGWGTALKPAFEPVIMARKPLAGTVAATVLAHGTGALNIDASRVATSDDTRRTCNGVGDSSSFDMAASGERRVNGGSPSGRWPANVLLDPEAAAAVDEQSAKASRFFPVFKYQAKAPKHERPEFNGIKHPTVKPLALMSWLVTLVTPPGGTVLDPFAGSGTTLQAARDAGFTSIGVEQSEDYCRLIERRLCPSTDEEPAARP